MKRGLLTEKEFYRLLWVLLNEFGCLPTIINEQGVRNHLTTILYLFSPTLPHFPSQSTPRKF